MRAFLLPGALALILGGCGPAEDRPARAAPPVAVPGQTPGSTPTLIAVQGQTANALLARFGPAAIDLKEGQGRKLQFQGPLCVLDAYLYAPSRGREEVVRHVDTRQRNGGPIDELSCTAALTRRP